ncbi:MAG: hypothetical protein JWO36_7155 [Myxococcales bacterium]|nr:hypothetical protein [Myxococcales bacterium]
MIAQRALHYDTPAAAAEDRPDHVRAASGLAHVGDRLVVIQDDTSFLGVITPGGVSAIALPRGSDGRRRFEVALRNKAEKLDLESCVAIDGELWAFGSGSTPKRERICRVRDDVPSIIDAGPLYARVRQVLGGSLNIEGVAYVAPELWLFHRGNTGLADPGPAIVRVSFPVLRAWLDGSSEMPAVLDVRPCDLGSIGGTRLGFTDAVAAHDRVYYLAAAEASANAVDDGAVLGSQVGVIAGNTMRAAPICGPDGVPIKAEGLALAPGRVDRAYIAVDPDDTDRAATLYEVELTGPW